MWEAQEVLQRQGCILKDRQSAQGGCEGPSRKGRMSKRMKYEITQEVTIARECGKTGTHFLGMGYRRVIGKSGLNQKSVMLEYELSPSCNGYPPNKQRSYIVTNIFKKVTLTAM